MRPLETICSKTGMPPLLHAVGMPVFTSVSLYAFIKDVYRENSASECLLLTQEYTFKGENARKFSVNKAAIRNVHAARTMLL